MLHADDEITEVSAMSLHARVRVLYSILGRILVFEADTCVAVSTGCLIIPL